MSKRKNKSKKIPKGRTVQTRDEYFEGQKNYIKSGYEKKGHYRKAVVIDTNKEDELVLVKLLGGKGIILHKYEKGKSGYRPFVETKDDNDNPIKIGYKFKENNSKKDISHDDVVSITKETCKYKKNRHKIRIFKKRK